MKLPILENFQHSFFLVLLLLTIIAEVFIILFRFGVLQRTKSLYIKQLADFSLLIICTYLYVRYAEMKWCYTLSGIPCNKWFLDNSHFSNLFFIGLAFLLLRAIYLIYSFLFDSEGNLTLLSLKQALDNLASGIIFSELDGRIIIANRVAIDIYQKFTEQELWNARPIINLGNQKFRIGDSVWQLKQQKIDLFKKQNIYQITANDITKLEDMLATLENQKSEHESKREEIKKVLTNLKENKRQEALLQTRYDLHAQLGYTVSVLDRIKTSDLTQAEKITKLSEILSMGIVLSEYNFSEKLDNLIESFAKLNLKIEINGEAKFDPLIEKGLISILREAAINAVKHGNAELLIVNITPETDQFVIEIKNKGELPKTKIKEGSGISSMRKRISDLGGKLNLAYDKEFIVTLYIPRI